MVLADAYTQKSAVIAAYRGGWGVQPPTPKFRSFDKVEPDCKLSVKYLVFLFQHINSLKIAEFRTPTPQDVRKKGSKILKLPRFAIVLHVQLQINW